MNLLKAIALTFVFAVVIPFLLVTGFELLPKRTLFRYTIVFNDGTETTDLECHTFDGALRCVHNNYSLTSVRSFRKER